MMKTITASQLLRNGLEALGPNGENWIKHSLGEVDEPGPRCALGAVYLQVYVPPNFSDAALPGALNALTAALPPPYRSVSGYNDLPETTFADIKSLFERAIDATERAEDARKQTVLAGS